MAEDLAIGIDLGTTNSCAALFKDGKLKVLENSEGNRITPSFVFFTNLEETLVGDHAKRMAIGQPEFGISEIKRLIGRKFDDLSVQKDIRNFPFLVEQDASNEPMIVIRQENKTITKTPQEVSTIILQEVKSYVESKLGQTVYKAVITVPAYFDQRQREVTLEAAKAAGFTVLKLLNEPTAAALSFFFEKDKCTSTTYSLVYDLGGGTFDVAILKKRGDAIEIVSVDGDTHLGGHDLDNLVVNYVCEQLKTSYGYDARNDKENMRRLYNKCEEAKKALSKQQETVIRLNGFVEGHPKVTIGITKALFEELAKTLFRRTIDIVENCLKASGVAKTDIEHIILAGGSTRIPKIEEMLKTCFQGKVPSRFTNPDECVAEGAALQAAMLPGRSSRQEIQEMKLVDVIPLSLGTDIFVNRMDVIIKRNTPIPTRKHTVGYTVYDQQKSMTFKIYEGERSDCRKNRFLGKMTLTNLTPAPPGQCSVDITMSIDENGILKLTAKEFLCNNVKELTFDYVRSTKSEKEVQNTLTDSEENREEDLRFEKFDKAKSYFLCYCISARYNFEAKNLTKVYESIYDLCKTLQKEAKELEVEDEDYLRKLTSRIKCYCEPIIRRYEFDFMPVNY